MKSSQNLRIARTGHKTAKSGVFSLKSDFGGRGTPQTAHCSKFPEIFWNFRLSHTLRHWFRVYFACVQCQNVPECVSTLLAVIPEQFTAWLHPANRFWKFWSDLGTPNGKERFNLMPAYLIFRKFQKFSKSKSMNWKLSKYGLQNPPERGEPSL